MAYSKAISSIEVFENISFADTGRDCPEALIASVSDFMLALVEVSFSVVYSRKKEGIKISVRSERPTLDAGKIISKALKGIGSGGGHATMAGGFVPFDGNDREEDLMIQNIRERFIDVISRTKRKSLRSVENLDFSGKSLYNHRRLKAMAGSLRKRKDDDEDSSC